MPSSTSNSDRKPSAAERPGSQHPSPPPGTPESVALRQIPDGGWLRRFALALLIAIVVLGAWELRVRGKGYAPTLNDSGDLWASVRSGLEPDGVVAIGSSRILFDLDLAATAEHLGVSHVTQLALPGSRPLGVLEHLAAEPSFRGTVLCGVVPPLYFVPAGFPVDRTDQALGRFEDWSPSQRAGHRVARVVQKLLAQVQQEDLTLNALLASRLNLANREGTRPYLPPTFPPYFQRVEDDRQTWMWEACDFGSPLARRIQEIWVPLFTPPPPPPGVTPEQARAGYEASMEDILARTKEAVETIVARGGRVVFLRFPSRGKVRELEAQFAPRPGFWERILAVSGSPGVHFEDHPALAAYDCPEWSHLTKADARRYTQALLPILDAALGR